MRNAQWERIPGAAGISLLGVILTGVTLFDIYEDTVVQGDPLLLTLFENSLPLALNVALVGIGYALIRRDDLRLSSVARTAKWTFLGAISIFGITGWVYYFQILQGEIKPHIIFSHVVSMGAVAGLGIGIYDARRSEQEDRLRTEHDRLAALFENSSDCIAEVEFVDGEPLIRDVNPAFRRVFGYDPESIKGESLDEVIVPPDGNGDADEISERARRGEQFEVEEVARQTKDGDTRVFRLQAIPLDSASSGIDGYAVYSDVTAEHQYEQRMTALHESTRELMTMGSIEQIAMATVEAAEGVLDLGFTSIHLYDPDDDVLRPAAHTDLVVEVLGTPPTFGADEAIAWEVFESGTSRYVPDLDDADGAYDENSSLGSEVIVPLGDYGVMLVGALSTDAFAESEISLAKVLAANAEVAMERADRETRLEEQNERLETFTSIVSHDLRNPLSVADGYLQLARDGDEEALDRVDDALDRMAELIEDLLALARQGAAIDTVEPVALATVAREAWANTATAAATLRVEQDGEIDADPDRLQQLLENLFVNSVEHGSTGSAARGDAVEHRTAESEGQEGDDEEITVYVTRTDAGFTVEDDGRGIPEDDRDQVLERGYTTAAEGTGFGLAIVKEIAEAHGWTMTVGEGRFGGAKFTFETDS